MINLDNRRHKDDLVLGVDAGNETSSSLMAQVRLTVGFEIFEHLGAFAGISYDFFHKWNSNSPMPENVMNGEMSWSDDRNLHRLGFFAGIQF
jgi:hypothetical protein